MLLPPRAIIGCCVMLPSLAGGAGAGKRLRRHAGILSDTAKKTAELPGMPMRRALSLTLTLAAAMLAGAARAQDAQTTPPWPNRPITIMGGFPNGAGTDIYARKLAEPLSRALGVSVVGDNRSGAGCNMGSGDDAS